MKFKGKKKQKFADREFTEQQLPHNRRQQFFDCLKVRFSLFMRIGVILLLFLLPCFILAVYRDFTFIGFGARLSEGEITSEQYFQMTSGTNMVVSAIDIVCLAVASVGFAGTARVIRQLIWGEAVFFRNDFSDGVRANGKSYVILFVLIGAVNFINTLTGSMQFPVEIVKYIPFAISVVVLLPVALFILSQTVVYKNNVRTLLKNGCILYMKSAPVVWLFLCAFVLFFLTGFIPLVFVKYVLQVALIVFVLPLFMLGWLLNSFSLFDKYINKNQFPELYNRGVSAE